MNKKRWILPIIFSIFLFSGAAAAYGDDGSSVFRSALESFGRREYDTALRSFREIIIRPSYSSFHGAAYYWIGRSYLALDDSENSAKNIEFFLSSYPGHPLYPDGLYQKGRLLFLKDDFEPAIEVFYTFLEDYPDHALAPSAYYWTGESLFSLGHFDEAKKIFSFINRIHPGSVKAEASEFRGTIIDLKERELELIKLLKMSHEEYLKALDEFQLRERNYDQLINSLQRRIAAAASSDQKELFDQLEIEVAARDEEIASLKRRIAYLEEQQDRPGDERETETAPVAEDRRTGPATDERALLRIKEESLELKAYLLEQLAKELGTLE